MGDGNRLRDTGIDPGVTGLNVFYRVSTSFFCSLEFHWEMYLSKPKHTISSLHDLDIKCEVSREEYDPDHDTLVLFTQWRQIQ